MPGQSKGDQRLKWIEEIEKHQDFSHQKCLFNVCIQHFKPSDYKKNGEKFILNPDAVPSIFIDRDSNYHDSNEIIGHELVDEISKSTHCNQCPFLLNKISELKHEMLLMKIENSNMMQKLEQKNLSLKQIATDKTIQLAETKNELSAEKKTTFASQRYIG